jgi:hypothetical protein
MLGMRFASIVFPDPGGPIIRMLWTLSGQIDYVERESHLTAQVLRK